MKSTRHRAQINFHSIRDKAEQYALVALFRRGQGIYQVMFLTFEAEELERLAPPGQHTRKICVPPSVERVPVRPRSHQGQAGEIWQKDIACGERKGRDHCALKSNSFDSGDDPQKGQGRDAAETAVDGLLARIGSPIDTGCFEGENIEGWRGTGEE